MGKAYSIYQGILRQFEDGFDPFKYNFKSPSLSDEKIQDLKYFKLLEKAGQDYKTENNFLLYCLGNVVMGNRFIGDFTDEAFKQWHSGLATMDYTFARDIKDMAEKIGKHNFNRLFTVDKPGQMPFIYTYQCTAAPESLAILELLLSFTITFDKELSDPFDTIKKKSRYIREYKRYLVNVIDLKTSYDEISKVFTINTNTK